MVFLFYKGISLTLKATCTKIYKYANRLFC